MSAGAKASGKTYVLPLALAQAAILYAHRMAPAIPLSGVQPMPASSRRPTAQALAMLVLAWTLVTAPAVADVGDPQVRTDHAWYPGELACSTFERLFATQAAVYERVVGVKPVTDEQKALAAWLWRNTHYAHGKEGTEDLWGLPPARSRRRRDLCPRQDARSLSR